MSKFVIISQPDCKWCQKAKDLLTRYGIEHEETNIADNATMRTFFQTAGFKTVPQVFHNGKHIGGYENLQAYIYHGNLD